MAAAHQAGRQVQAAGPRPHMQAMRGQAGAGWRMQARGRACSTPARWVARWEACLAGGLGGCARVAHAGGAAPRTRQQSVLAQALNAMPQARQGHGVVEAVGQQVFVEQDEARGDRHPRHAGNHGNDDLRAGRGGQPGVCARSGRRCVGRSRWFLTGEGWAESRGKACARLCSRRQQATAPPPHAPACTFESPNSLNWCDESPPPLL